MPLTLCRCGTAYGSVFRTGPYSVRIRTRPSRSLTVQPSLELSPPALCILIVHSDCAAHPTRHLSTSRLTLTDDHKRRPSQSLQPLSSSHMQQLLAAVLLETPCDSNPQSLQHSSNWVSSSLSILPTINLASSNHVESSRLAAAHHGDSSQYGICT